MSMEQRAIRQPIETKQPEEAFLDFVQTQIQKLQEYSRIGADKEISFYELNNALCNYQSIYLTLLSLYNVAKIDHAKQKENFEDWFADKYIDIRRRENRTDISAQKWVSQRELELMVRKEFRGEYHMYNDMVLVAEHKVAFLRRLLEGWTSQQYILATLSKNLIAEVGSETTSSALRS